MNLWKLLGSMKFAIWLLVAAALLSLIALLASELLPQEAQLSAVAKFLQLTDPFRSWWFRSLLGIMAVSLAVCVTERTPILIRQAFGRTFRTEINQFQKKNGCFEKQSTDGDGKVRELMTSLGLSVKTENTGDRRYYSGVSGSISRLGPLLTHLGMLLLIFGGLASGISGKTSRVSGGSGDVISEPEWGFSLRIEDFQIKYYPPSVNQWVEATGGARGQISEIKEDSISVKFMAHNEQEFFRWYPADSVRNDFLTFQNGIPSPYQGNIKSYQTQATVIVDEQSIFSRKIEVNHPLRFRGFRFYQSSFDLQEIKTEVDSVVIICKNSEGESLTMTLGIEGDAYTIPWNGQKIAVAEFYPDFRLDANMEAFSASGSMNNPAARIIVYEAEKEVSRQWVFPRDLSGMGHSESDLTMKLENVRGIRSVPGGYITILEVNKTRGTWLIWLGFILMTLGLTLAYSLTHRKAWALVRKVEKSPDEVYIAFASNREEISFKERGAARIKEIFG